MAESEREDQVKYRMLMENLPDGLLTVRVDNGEILEKSKGLLELLGCSKDSFQERYQNLFYKLIYPADLERVREMIEAQAEFLHSILVNFRIMDASENVRFFEFSARELVQQDGVKVYVAILKDVNEAMLLEQKVRKLEEQLGLEQSKYKLLMETMQETAFSYDTIKDELEIVYSNRVPSFRRLVDFRLEQGVRKLIDSADFELFQEKFQEALEKNIRGTVTLKAKQRAEDWDQQEKWFCISYASVSRNDGSIGAIVGAVSYAENQEITGTKQLCGEETDEMTGLLNKAAIKHRIQEQLAQSTPQQSHVLLYIDADDFVQINENLGRVYGDEVIRFMAATISQTLLKDDLTAHIGGDEFLIFMKECDIETAREYAVRLIERMRLPFEKDGISISITCSMGIACYPQNGIDFETLCENAETAMCDAKIAGKDRYLFSL